MKKDVFFLFFLVLFIVFPKIILSCMLVWLLSKFAKKIYSDFAAVRARVKLKKVKEK